MLVAKKVADILGIAVRTVYNLPIPKYKIGGAIRWDESDVEEYKKSCRFTSTEKSAVTVSSLTVKLESDDTALQNYFQKLGRKKKPTSGQDKKKPDSTHLRAVK